MARIPRGQRKSGDNRGGSRDRRERKRWLLERYGHECCHCGTPLTFETVECDRKRPGGSYARNNIQASCGSCNRFRSNNRRWSLRLAALQCYIDHWEA